MLFPENNDCHIVFLNIKQPKGIMIRNTNIGK